MTKRTISVKKNVEYEMNGFFIIGKVSEADRQTKYTFYPKAETIMARMGECWTTNNIQCLIDELEMVRDFVNSLVVADELADGSNGKFYLEEDKTK